MSEAVANARLSSSPSPPWPDADHEVPRLRAGRRRRAWEARALAVRARSGAADTRAVALARGMEVCGTCPDAVVEAAAAMLDGAVVDLRGSDRRRQAVSIAALSLALLHPGVHLCTMDDTETSRLESNLAPAAARLGLALGIVTRQTDIAARQSAYRKPLTIVAATELAIDTMRDRKANGPAGSAVAVKIGRLTGRTGRAIIPELRRVLVSDGDAILLDRARMLVTLHDSLPPLHPIDAVRQAVGLAMLLSVPDDAIATATGFVLTQSGEGRVDRVAHLYPALAVETAVGRCMLLEAVAALHGFRRDADFTVERGQLVQTAANDGALIGFDAAGPYLAVANGLVPAPRKVPVARTRLQRVLSRYQVVAGAGVHLHRAGRELRQLYPVGGPVRIGGSRPVRSSVRRLAGEDEIVRHIASLGDVVVIPPDAADAAERLRKTLAGAAPAARLMLGNTLETPRPPKHIVLLTGSGGELDDLRRIEDLAGAETRVERIVDTTAASYFRWPVWLRAALAAMPSQTIRNRVTAGLITLIDRAASRRKSRSRAALFRYDERLDDMLSFAGEAE